MLRTLAVLVLLSLVTVRGASARLAPPDTTLSGPDLQADVDLLARAYGALHPGLYRYQTPGEWDARVADLRAEVAGGMGQRAFYVRLARLLAAVECGHSYPNFFNQSPAVQRRVLEATPRLPFYFRWVGDEMVITRDLSGRDLSERDLSGSGLAPGTRVVSVDGTPAAGVLARLLPLARADGANDAKRREVLSVTGGEPYEAFDVYYPLVTALGDTVTVEAEGPLGAPRRTLRLATQSFAEREVARSTSSASPLGWNLRTLAGGTAVLTMPGWGTYEVDWDWRTFLDDALGQVIDRQSPRLVVDLRENEGGDYAVGEALLRAFAARSVSFAAESRYVRYRTLPGDLRSHVDTWDPAFADWTGALAADAGGDLLRLADPDSVTLTPGPRHYAGRVAVLVSAANSSSTFRFAEAVRRSGLGVLVGQTTGGNQRGIQANAFYYLRLPRSGVEVDVPLVGYYPPGHPPVWSVDGVPDGGLRPDVEVPLLPDDLAAGRDRTLDAALDALSAPVGAGPMAPPDRARLVAALDSAAQAGFRGSGAPGMSVAVVLRGDTLLMRGYGVSDAENDVAATPETVYRIGSLTKQVTAAAVVALAAKGRLDLDGSVQAVVGDAPEAWAGVTLRDLLNHTSGLPDYTETVGWQANNRLVLSPSDVLGYVRDLPLAYATGSRSGYSNTNYYLLGLAVERAAGEPYAAFLKERFFDRLGMTGTSYCDDRAVTPHRARGYETVEGGLVNADPLDMASPFAAGGLCSTARDLVRWAGALSGGAVVGADGYAAMTAPAVLVDGTTAPYGFGLELGTDDGHRTVTHGGGIDGFASYLATWPDDGLAVAVAWNSGSAYPRDLAVVLGNLVLDSTRRQESAIR